MVEGYVSQFDLHKNWHVTQVVPELNDKKSPLRLFVFSQTYYPPKYICYIYVIYKKKNILMSYLSFYTKVKMDFFF